MQFPTKSSHMLLSNKLLRHCHENPFVSFKNIDSLSFSFPGIGRLLLEHFREICDISLHPSHFVSGVDIKWRACWQKQMQIGLSRSWQFSRSSCRGTCAAVGALPIPTHPHTHTHNHLQPSASKTGWRWLEIQMWCIIILWLRWTMSAGWGLLSPHSWVIPVFVPVSVFYSPPSMNLSSAGRISISRVAPTLFPVSKLGWSEA